MIRIVLLGSHLMLKLQFVAILDFTGNGFSMGEMLMIIAMSTRFKILLPSLFVMLNDLILKN